MPEKTIILGDGEVTQIENTYDAMGNKLQTMTMRQAAGIISPGGTAGTLSAGNWQVPDDEKPSPGTTKPYKGWPTTDYCGNAVYQTGKLSMLLTGEGYVTFTNDSTPVYHYFLRDHLGSVRVVFRQDGAVEQVNHYYASGALMWDISTGGTVQPYKFGGKEMERTAGLDWCDFSARWLDTALGPRFTTMDPLCEKYYDVSPYAYCGGDPVNAVDPDGRTVKPSTIEAMEMIHNTLPKECLSYVQFDSNGYINRDLINSYEYDDLNFNNLKTLVNDPMLVNVSVDNTFFWRQGLQDADGRSNPDRMYVLDFNPLYDETPDPLNNIEDVSSGQTGFTGKTLFPDLSGAQCSPDNSVYVIINKELTESARADAFCHEGFGHALLYVKSGYDRNRAIHHSEGNEEKNIELKKMILDSRRSKFNNY